MTLNEAKAECARWFASLKRDEERSLALQTLAAARRAGLSDEEMRERRRTIDCTVTVYDGANLERAVRTLLKHVR